MYGICGFTDFTRKIVSGGEDIIGKRRCGEHSLLIQRGGGEPVHRTVEGYDFSVVYSGALCEREKLAAELEAYGYSFMSDSEAETVLYMYIHYGEECVKRLRGSFAFAVNDCMRRRVFLCCRGTDLTYMKNENAVLFSSDERLLFQMAKKTPQIDSDGLRRIFANGCDRGVLKNVFCLPEEHCMMITRRGIAVKQYADMPEADISEAERIVPLFKRFLKPIVSETLGICGCDASAADYAAFMRGRTERITDIFMSPCRFESGDYRDMLRKGFFRAAEENAPITALCDVKMLSDYISSEELSAPAAEFIIRINKLLYGVRIV